MHDRSRLVPNDRTTLNLSHLANKHCISTLQTDTLACDFFLTAIRCKCRHQQTKVKEYRDARRRSGEADWSCRQGTATRGPCRRPARTFLDTSLILRRLAPIWFGGATAFPRAIEHMPSEMCMETSGLHAHFDAQATSGAAWSSAKPTTRARTKTRWADL